MNAIMQKDTTYTKIFVGGLPYHTTDESLRDFFKQFGDIDEAVVITDRQTSKSRGYGFVTMSERTGAEKACKEPNPIIDGRKANVNLAYLGAKPRVLPVTLKQPIGFPNLPAQPYILTTPSPYVGTTTTPTQVIPNITAAPVTPSQVVDLSAYQTTVPSMTSYDALAAQYQTYMTPTVTAGAVPFTYQIPQAGGLYTTTPHYQPQQIQPDRMQ